MKLNHKRLLKRIDNLAKIGQSRLALSFEDKLARDLLCSWMKEIGLKVEIDRIGNIFAFRSGKSNRQIMIGSHIDTVKNAGKYDGILGVLAGLEIAQTLTEKGIVTDKTLVVASFTNEEGIRYTPDMMGSLYCTGDIEIENIYSKKSPSGILFKDELEKIDYKGDFNFDRKLLDLFLELHIEQGPVLEIENLDIGIVDGVQGIYWLEIKISGTANHAGTTPMHLRKDAFLLANKIARYADQLSEDIPNQLATVGRFELKPNAINIVPAEIIMTVDLRNPDSENLNIAIRDLKQCIHELQLHNKIEIELDELVHFEPVQFSIDIMDEIETIVTKKNYKYRRLTSGAGHDAQMMVRFAQTAMIFIPSQNGVSHNPAEYSTTDQIKKGLDVLAELTIKKLMTQQ